MSLFLAAIAALLITGCLLWLPVLPRWTALVLFVACAGLWISARQKPGLYVKRDVLNSEELRAWASEAGLASLVADPHVTICYSQSRHVCLDIALPQTPTDQHAALQPQTCCWIRCASFDPLLMSAQSVGNHRLRCLKRLGDLSGLSLRRMAAESWYSRLSLRCYSSATGSFETWVHLSTMIPSFLMSRCHI
jgi:hypothetical protein